MASKRWVTTDKPSVLFATTHKDRTGGGELYAHQVAKQLDSMCDLRYFTGNTGPLHPDFGKYHGSRHRFTVTGLVHPTDIFVTCSHFQIPRPTGRHRNVVLTFFPNPDHRAAVRQYDTVVTCSNFSAKWVKKYWGKKATVIHPFVDLSSYRADEKKKAKSILSVGRFFREPHRHSKRQDTLIKAFAILHKKEQDWSLVLAGSVLSPSDRNFLEHCKSRARDLGVGEAVEFHENADFGSLCGMYGEAEFYWHANGYGSDGPYETEHFGIVIAEAMASGCTPIIYDAGGCGDFPARTWRTPAELVRKTISAHKTNTKSAPVIYRKFVEEHFTEVQMNADVRDLFFRR